MSKTFVIFSHEGYFMSIAMKMKAPVIWADMTKEETEPDEAKELSDKVPSKVPSNGWGPFFDYQREQRRKLTGKGIITRFPAKEVLKKLLAMPDWKRKEFTVIFDFNHGTKYGEKLKAAGFRGIFAQDWAYDLERKREKASEMVAKLYRGVGIPKQVKFGANSADKMIQFIEQNEESVWVVKPNGQGMWVFCPASEDGPIAAEESINHIKANVADINAIPMILQEKIIGVEINIETAYSSGSPLYAMVDLENKFTHPEELGHQSGCAFDLVFPVPLDCKLRVLCNQPFDALAKKIDFTGFMDMNAIISNKDGKPYFIEFCPNRFGYNAFFTELELSGKTPDEFLLGLVSGKLTLPDSVFGASVKLFNEDHHQDFMSSVFNPEYKNVEVQLSNPDLTSVWFFDVYREKGKYRLAHYSEEAIVVTAHSDTAHGAIEKAKMKAVRDISFDGKYARSDIDEYDRLYNPVCRYQFLKDHKLLEV